MCRKAKSNMMLKDCRNTKGDSGKMWKVINRALKSKDKPSITPDFVIKVETVEGNTKKNSG